MAEVINLRRARKTRDRAAAAKAAEANRAKFGEPTALRRQREAEGERAARALDGARLEPEGD